MAYQYPLNGGRLNASIGGNSTSAGAGYALLSTGTLLLAGGNNVTLSQNANSITISGGNLNQTNQTLGLYATGNTTQNSTATADARSLSFNGLGGMSVGYSNSSVQLSAPALSSISATGIVSISKNGSNISIGAPAFSAGVASNSTVSNQFILTAGNNITLSQSTNATGATVTVSAASQSAQSLGLYAAGNTTQSSSSTADARSLSFNGLGALSVGYSGGSVQLSAPNYSSVSATGALSISNNGNTVSMGVPAFSVGVASNSTVSNQFILTGGNNITLSQSTNATGATVTVSAANQSVQTQNMVSINGSTGNVSFDNAGNVKFGLNASTITASYSQTNQTQSVIQGIIASGSANYTGNISFANSNGITFGLSNNTLTASHNALTSQSLQTQGVQTVNLGGNTAGAMASISSGAMSLYGGNNITLSQNANSVTIIGTSGGGGGGGGIALANSNITLTSGTANLSVAGGALTISGTSQSFNFSAPALSSLSATGGLTLSTSGSTISIGAPATSSIVGTNGINLVTAGNTISIDGSGLSTLVGGGGGGTISNWEPQQLQFATLGSNTNVFATNSVYIYKLEPQAYVSASQLLQLANISNATTSSSTNQVSLSIYAGIYTVTGSTLSLITQSSGSQSYSWSNSSNNTASYNGIKALTLPMNLSATPGNYWIGIQQKSATAGTAASISNVVFTNAIATFAGLPGQSQSASQGIQEGVGVYTSSTTALPSAIPMNSIIQSSNRLMPYMAFKNITW